MGTTYAIASAKGGVGKTTTTAALATVLAEAGYDVVAVDADVGMANLGSALGVDIGGTTIHDVLAGHADPLDAVHDGPAGMRLLPGEVDLDAYANADPSALRDVVDAFEDAEYVLIDVGAGLSHESSIPLALADETLLVSTLERDALGDTEKTRQLVERLGGTVAGAVITRVPADEAGSDALTDVLETDVIGRIPEDDAVRRAARDRRPLVPSSPNAPATRAYRSLVGALTGRTTDDRRSAVSGTVDAGDADRAEGVGTTDTDTGGTRAVSQADEEPSSAGERLVNEAEPAVNEGEPAVNEGEPAVNEAEPEAVTGRGTTGAVGRDPDTIDSDGDSIDDVVHGAEDLADIDASLADSVPFRGDDTSAGEAPSVDSGGGSAARASEGEDRDEGEDIEKGGAVDEEASADTADDEEASADTADDEEATAEAVDDDDRADDDADTDAGQSRGFFSRLLGR